MMKKMIKLNNSLDASLESSHRYKVGDYEFVSVSDFINLFKKPFKKEEIAYRVAQKEEVSKEFIINKWDLNAEISRNYGNSIHKGIEYWIRYGEESKLPHIKKAIKEFSKLHNRENLLAETILYDDEYGIAGTVDIIEVEDDEISIWDIKTNAELDDTSYNNFKEPIEDIKQSKLNIYNIQLSMYKRLVELNNIKVGTIGIEHWNGKGFETIELEPFEISKLLEYEE